MQEVMPLGPHDPQNLQCEDISSRKGCYVEFLASPSKKIRAGPLRLWSKAMPLIEENYVPGMPRGPCRDGMRNHENPSDRASGIVSHENS